MIPKKSKRKKFAHRPRPGCPHMHVSRTDTMRGPVYRCRACRCYVQPSPNTDDVTRVLGIDDE